MELSVYRFVTLPSLREIVPKRYYSQFKWSESTDERAAIILFQHGRNEILTAETVQKVCSSLFDLNEKFRIAIGTDRNFTREATQVLASFGFRLPNVPPPAPSPKKISPFPQRVNYSSPHHAASSKIENWETANKLLGCLGVKNRDYAIFALPDDSYIQCLGSKTALTVEARIYHPDRSFKHIVFGKGPLTGQRTTVGKETGFVTIDTSQRLKMRDARLIIRQFLESRTFPENFSQLDITDRFSD
ncbi:MAG: hypothetical protein U1F65_00580 [Verrucomicrobiota bacterium]